MTNPLWQQWVKTASVSGGKTLLIDASTGERWTARHLNRRVEKFADELPPGRSGERIAFRLNGADGIALLLALQKTGWVAVPFDAGMPKEGCWSLAQRLQVRAVYSDGIFLEFEGPWAKDRTCSYLKLTSGSSAGESKVIQCRAEHLLADGAQLIRGMGLRRTDRHLAVIPFGHSYGLGSLLMPLIMQGATLIYSGQFVLRQLIGWITHFKTTVFPGVPVLFRSLAAIPGAERLPSLRLAISAGAPLQAEVARAFFERYQVKVHNFYGSSETGGICYDRTGAASLSGRSVGKPLKGVTVTVRAGKIVVQSPAVATRGGRWQLPDAGQWNERGELVLMGRRNDSANIGGKKIHPVEVEKVLRGNSQVSDVGVWVLHANGRDYLAVAVETKLSQREIELHLRAHLPEWKMPKRYFVAKELPRTPQGKLNAALLREQLGSA